MKKAGIQFHATHEEIAEILKALCEAKSVYACLVENRPFSVRNLNVSADPRSLDLSDVIFNGINFIYFGEGPFVERCDSIAEFRNKNEHHTSLLVGKQGLKVLEDSFFSCLAMDEGEYRFGKNVCAFIKKYTVAGLIPVGANGQRGKLSKIFRYTKGAREFYSSGGELKAMVGTAHFEVP